ncbi:MAG TPA: Eco47II family restriction endonuclease [Paludibacter sp.]
MNNRYVNFITDEHFLSCVDNLYKSYLKANSSITKKDFYKNKVDVIKLTFDAKFNNINEDKLIEAEIIRQVDKSINNSIGTFHEQILGGIIGYKGGYLSGFDIKANDDTLFADIKNKHNTMNSSSAEALFQKLSVYANTYKKSKCYWVQILAKKSFEEQWVSDINGKEYSHSRVFKISGDRFYALLSGEKHALLQLYKALPLAIDDYLKLTEQNKAVSQNSAINEISESSLHSKRKILDQITSENYSYYWGFEEL